MNKVVFILLLMPLLMQAQPKNKVDSLNKAVQSAKTPAAKCKLYLQLAAYNRLGDDIALKSNLDSANALNRIHGTDSASMVINKGYAEYFLDVGKADTAIKYVNKAIGVATLLKNNAVKATCLNLKGNALMAKRDFKNAQSNYLEAMRLYVLLNNQYAIGNLYVNLGYLLQQQHQVKEAEKQYAEADTIFKKLNDNDRLAQLYNNYGILYGENNQFIKAEHYFEVSTRIREKLSDQVALANSYLNVGGINVLLKNYPKGELYLLKSKALFQKLQNIQGETSCLTNLGELYSKTKQYAKAIDYCKQSIALAKANNNMEDLENALLGISETYKEIGDYKAAFGYQETLGALKDSIYQKSLSRQIAEMQAKYETEKKEHQIGLLNQENVIQKLALSNRNKIIVIITAFFIICAALGALYYRQYKSNQETRLQAAVIYQQNLAAQGIIAAEERERKRIAGDLHDGVGQLFSTVKMNLETLVERYLIKQPDAQLLAEKTVAMVDESCTEVRSIAHQMMPNALLKSGLVSALRDFVNKIPADRLKVSIETKGINDRLADDIETVLYRVVQESVNNVIKHAEATTLDILLLCDEQEITVTIEDNGKGFNTDDKSKFAGIGLKNMTSRVEYLKGAVDISSSQGKGTLVAIYVPLN